jgi:hypothetical protein
MGRVVGLYLCIVSYDRIECEHYSKRPEASIGEPCEERRGRIQILNSSDVEPLNRSKTSFTLYHCYPRSKVLALTYLAQDARCVSPT